MAMILDAFAGGFIEKLASLANEKVVMVLGFKDELKRLHQRMARIKKFLEAAERRQLEDPAIKRWVGELKDISFDADDIMDRCCIVGGAALSLVDRPSSSKKLTEIYKDRSHLKLEESRELPKLQTITTVKTGQIFPMEEDVDVLGTEIEEKAENEKEKEDVDGGKKWKKRASEDSKGCGE